MKSKWLIVGAGFTGSVLAERIASVLHQDVLLIDRRDHIGGNAFDAVHSTGLLYHKYGPHIFHTNSDKVWNYLSEFTTWRPYMHRVLAMIEGNLIPVPFNLNSINLCFPKYLAERINEQLIDKFGYGARVPILKLKMTDSADLQFLASYIYDNVFLQYTLKQWGMAPEHLDPAVTARIPVCVNRDDRYFQDRYQAMPADGYTAMFNRILSRDRIELRLSTSFEAVEQEYKDGKIIFTGPIDEYFQYSFGPLPYRSLNFENREIECDDLAQKVGTINYPNNYDFTRITEVRHLTAQKARRSLLCEEYPCPYVPGSNEPYYPIPNESTAQLFRKYAELGTKLSGQVWFAGRLGDYAYYNMDQACARALSLFEKQIKVHA